MKSPAKAVRPVLLVVGLLTLLLATLATACGGGEEPTPTPPTPKPVATPTRAAAPATTPTAAPATQQKSSAPVPPGFPRPELLVDTAWLEQHAADRNLRIIDVRPAAQYGEAHIPGAVNLLVSQFSVSRANIPNELPTAEEFAKLMSGAGVSNDTQVVIYDEGNALNGGRLLWTLEYFGHTKASVLNGGIAAWKADNRELTRIAPAVPSASFTPKPNPSLFADKAYVQANLGKVLLLDARTAGEYAGTDVRAPATRGGHVPGAKNVDWTLNLTQKDGVPTFKSPAELKAMYDAAGLTRDKEIVAYCQSAVRSANAYLTLRLLGYDKVRNYDGSWAEWGNDPATPVEK